MYIGRTRFLHLGKRRSETTTLAAMPRTILKFLACLLFAMPVLAATPEVQFDNPLLRQRADPHAMLHTDGQYYFIATVGGMGSHRAAPHAGPERASDGGNEGAVARARRGADERAHLGARDPLHRRQVVHLFHGEPQRRDLGSAALRARERIARSLQGRMERARPPRDRLGQLLARRHHVQTPGQALLRVDAARTHAGGRPRHQHLHRADGFAEIDHRQGHDADPPRVRMGEAQVRRQRRPGRADSQWQGVHDVLGERDRRQLLHGAADRVRRCGPARPRVVEEIARAGFQEQ